MLGLNIELKYMERIFLNNPASILLYRAKCLITAALWLICCLSVTANAHFQLLYTPELALKSGAATHLSMVFTHPFTTTPTMDMGKPQAFYVVSQRGEAKPKSTDLSSYLKPVEWHGTSNSAQAYTASLPRSVVRSLGDYIFVMEPSPFYEEPEDKYIQQITKTIMNVGGVPGNWATPLGLKAEILPLGKPYANWTGGVFRGVVLAQGKPVPNAEIEVEYINHPPLQGENEFRKEAEVVAPQASYQIATIYADDRGQFSIGLPRAGFWGVCALNIGPDKQYQGKELSQDAVLWLQVKDMK